MSGVLRKLLLSFSILSGVAGVFGYASFSAFAGTTASPSAEFAAGTVALGDDDAGTPLYSVSNASPGDSAASCIRVAYTGSLDADVRLYASEVTSAGNVIALTITPGNGTHESPSCSGFTASGPPIYSGTLRHFADTYSSFEHGLATFPQGSAKWSRNDSVVYRVTVTLLDQPAGALSSGTDSFTWEAQNQ